MIIQNSVPRWKWHITTKGGEPECRTFLENCLAEVITEITMAGIMEDTTEDIMRNILMSIMVTMKTIIMIVTGASHTVKEHKTLNAL